MLVLNVLREYGPILTHPLLSTGTDTHPLPASAARQTVSMTHFLPSSAFFPHPMNSYITTGDDACVNILEMRMKAEDDGPMDVSPGSNRSFEVADNALSTEVIIISSPSGFEKRYLTNVKYIFLSKIKPPARGLRPNHVFRQGLKPRTQTGRPPHPPPRAPASGSTRRPASTHRALREIGPYTPRSRCHPHTATPGRLHTGVKWKRNGLNRKETV